MELKRKNLWKYFRGKFRNRGRFRGSFRVEPSVEGFVRLSVKGFVRLFRMIASDLPWKLPLASMELKRSNPWKCFRGSFPIRGRFRGSSRGSYFHRSLCGSYCTFIQSLVEVISMEAFVEITSVEALVGVTSVEAVVGVTFVEDFVEVTAVEAFVEPWKLSSKLA